MRLSGLQKGPHGADTGCGLPVWAPHNSAQPLPLILRNQARGLPQVETSAWPPVWLEGYPALYQAGWLLGVPTSHGAQEPSVSTLWGWLPLVTGILCPQERGRAQWAQTGLLTLRLGTGRATTEACDPTKAGAPRALSLPRSSLLWQGVCTPCGSPVHPPTQARDPRDKSGSSGFVGAGGRLEGVEGPAETSAV